MTNEIKFADTVILVDVAYVDRVAGDLSKHFGDVVGRKSAESGFTGVVGMSVTG